MEEMMDIKKLGQVGIGFIKNTTPTYMYGRDMQDHVTNSVFDDWCTWEFPDGAKEQIEDNQLYVVWYETHDASDPMDSSEKNIVVYIEKAPEEIQSMYEGMIYASEKTRSYRYERRKKLIDEYDGQRER